MPIKNRTWKCGFPSMCYKDAQIFTTIGIKVERNENPCVFPPSPTPQAATSFPALPSLEIRCLFSGNLNVKSPSFWDISAF